MRASVTVIIAFVLLATTTRDAHAQQRRQPSQQNAAPTMFASAWVGFSQMQIVDDGSTASSWDFGTTPIFRGSLEFAVGSESAIGVTASYAHAPLRYTDTGIGCGSCDAHASVQTIQALFHLGMRPGFHQVIEASAGVTQYRDFTQDSPKRNLLPKNDTDFSFAVGYGIGYGLSRTTAIQLVQDYASALHQREGLPGNARSAAQSYVTRIGMRYGF